MNIQGHWAPEWQPLVNAFAANFMQGEEGAGVALYHRGSLVVNVWAGQSNNRLATLTNELWTEDTLVNVFSSGKGLVALCILQLVSQGKLELDASIARYWPEFLQTSITLRQVLCHRSGLSAFHPVVSGEQIFDWTQITQIIACETPWWEPGSAQGYSPFIYGWILGELVRRVSGYASFNDYFQAQVAEPLGANCHFGVPGELLNTIADTSPLKRNLTASAVAGDADSFALGKLMKADPRGVTNRAFANPLTLMTSTNTQTWRQAQIPAANAHCNAAALATIYGALGCGNKKLLDGDTLSLAWQEQTFTQDAVLGLPLRFSHGFMLSQPQRSDCRYGRGARAFGHPGAGGSVGFADPDYELGFGYVTARMGQSLLIDERAVSLIDAAYNILGVAP